MTFLPIVQRELRAASRRPSTHRIRGWTAFLAIGASLIAFAGGRALPGTTGFVNALFGVQTACAFGLALLAGVFLTSDCLSEEKREGTLGLLLLTDLKSYDIVLGKFVATSVNALYCLLALLPVTAVPLLVGGVTLGEFCRMALVLVNAMFFSLAAGLCVSAFVSDYARALGITLAFVAATAAGLPALAALGSGAVLSPVGFCLGLASPVSSFICAGDTTYAKQAATFWAALFVSHLLAWFFLGVASVALAQLWPNGRAWARGGGIERSALWSRAGAIRRRRRGRIIPFDLVIFLTGDGAMLRWMVWTIVGGWALMACDAHLWSTQTILGYRGAKLFAFALKALVAFQACRFFVETRRNGSLELLLCAPLRNADLLQAQWRALRRIFLWPTVMFVLLQVATVIYLAPLSMGVPPGIGNLTETGFLGVFFLTISLLADMLAVSWFGMWLALTMKRPVLAPALTILFVLVLPSCLYRLDLVADMLFISWGTTQLQRDFRWLVLNPAQPALAIPSALSGPLASENPV